MTLLERFDADPCWQAVPVEEIRRAIAIAQAVRELPKLYGEFSYETNLAFVLNRRADELLEWKK